MTSWREKGRGFRYDFQLYGKRYRAPRGFRTKKQSDAAERALRDRLMAAHAGVPHADLKPSPRFTDWADVTYTYAVEREQLDDPASLDRNLEKALRFWGAKPEENARAGEPYHDLVLADPIRDGGWLMKFEQWMSAKGMAGSTKNHCRSAVSKMYRVAMLPEYRAVTGISFNPMRGILRDPPVIRETLLTREQLRSILAHASEPLKLAIRIAILAPELRLGRICALDWDEHIDADVSWIRMGFKHKTGRRTRKPLVCPIVPQLRAFLKAAERSKKCSHVIQANGAKVLLRQIQRDLEDACTAAEIAYGVKAGVTFHTLRHTAATWMAEIGVPEQLRKQAIGHAAIQTTQGYTHLAPLHKIAPLQELAANVAGELGEPEKESPAGLPRIGVAK